MRTGDSYDVRVLGSVDEAPTFVVTVVNETLGVRASGRPSRDLEEAEMTAWAAVAAVEQEQLSR